MDGKQVGSSAGLLAMIALLMHMFGGSPDARSAKVEDPKKANSSSLSADKKTAAHAFGLEGPWLATQQYFHREAENSAAAICRPYLIPEPSGRESAGCDTAALFGLYGIDKRFDAGQITTLIATVPDPLHTRMSLGTDRVLDAIQQAAYNADWEPATQWLPWTGKARDSTVEGSADLDPEELPGLIVFRKHFSNAANEHQLLLVFVVGETPTAGINGFQFEVARRSMFTLGSEHSGRVAILGPTFSGSFQSLTRLIESDRQVQSYEVRSGTVANSTYATSMIEALAPMGERFSFHGSTLPSRSFAGDFERLVKIWGYRQEQAAELVEDESGFSFSYVKSPITTYRYPRDIAQLRNAYSDVAFSRAGKQEGAAIPTLEFSLKDAQSGEDVFPIFSSNHTAVSQNAVLEQIVRALKRDGVRAVSLSASNVFDTLFLSKVLARYCPDTRVVLSGADLLFVENETQGALSGVMAISTYPLFPDGEKWANPNRHDITTFPDADSKAEYNAALALLKGPSEKTQGLEPVFGSDSSKLFSAWLLVLGRSGWYPVSLLPESNPVLAPGRMWFDVNTDKPVNKPRTELPTAPLTWNALCIAIAILSIGFCARLHYLRRHPRLLVWSNLCLVDLPCAECTQSMSNIEHMRYLCLFGCLGTLIFIAGIPLLPIVAAMLVYRSPATDWVIAVVAFAATAAPMWTAFNLWRSVPLEVRPDTPGGPGLRQAAILSRAFILLAPLAGLGCWLYCCTKGTDGWLLCYRALTLAPSVCPIWPLLLSGLALFGLLFFHLRRFTWGDRQQPLLDTGVFDKALWNQFGELKSRLDCVLRSPTRAYRPPDLFVVKLLVLGGAVLVLILLFPSDTLRSFEPTAFEYLLIAMLLPVVVGLAASFVQFSTCWSIIRAFLATLNSVVLGRFFSQLTDFGGSGPVWLRHVKLMSLATSVNSAIALHNLSIRSGSAAYQTAYWTALEAFLSSQQALHSRREFIDRYADFRRTAASITEELGAKVLKPYWGTNELPFVDSEEPDAEAKSTPPAARSNTEEVYRLASRYVALQYAAFIGYALRHLQNLLLCCTVGFVLLVLALSSFSFQAPQAISKFLIAILIVGAAVVLTVLAQIEKDAILSRLSGTTEGELGKGFFIRAFTYGAIPVLTVLGTRFPGIATFLSTWAEPTLSAMR